MLDPQPDLPVPRGGAEAEHRMEQEGVSLLPPAGLRGGGDVPYLRGERGIPQQGDFPLKTVFYPSK